MNNDRKKLYISAGINFIVGIILGIILFYGQLKSDPTLTEKIYTYDKSVTLADFIRLSWLNLRWIFSVFISHSILPLRVIHPVLTIRGCVNSFSILYILSVFGIKEAFATALGQCLSILPLLGMFSVEAVIRHRENVRNGLEAFSVKRRELTAIFVFSLLSAGVEVILFRLLCTYLF